MATGGDKKIKIQYTQIHHKNIVQWYERIYERLNIALNAVGL